MNTTLSIARLPSRLLFARVQILLLGLLLVGCEPVDVSMDARSLAWVVLVFALIISAQMLIIIMLLIRHPRLRRYLLRWGLAEPQLAKTRHQLYREIARHEATEELLRETQEYLQCIINSLPSVLVGITPEGFVTHWNTAAEDATGLAADEALGAHISHVYPGLPVEMDIIERVVVNGVSYTREGVQNGQGSQSTFLDITVCPLLSTEIAGAVILVDDVTLRVRLESMMIQSEKMMSLGELAAGLAHEINNPLAGILNNVQNILRRTSGELAANDAVAEEVGVSLDKVEAYLRKRQVLEFVENIGLAGERAAHIVKNMLEFSRGSSSQTHVTTDPVALVEQSLELAANTFELKTSVGVEMPRLERDYQPGLPLIHCSPTEIQQVLLNLLRNAAQAFQSDEYGPPLIPIIRIRVFREEQHVCIEVQDNGPGMADSVIKHIFEPFFTTKAVGQGTGLGLSVSYFIITEHHKGTIAVDSQPGHGTTFMIKLPIERQL